MTAYAVSTKVNDVKNDGPELIEPARQTSPKELGATYRIRLGGWNSRSR